MGFYSANGCVLNKVRALISSVYKNVTLNYDNKISNLKTSSQISKSWHRFSDVQQHCTGLLCLLAAVLFTTTLSFGAGLPLALGANVSSIVISMVNSCSQSKKKKWRNEENMMTNCTSVEKCGVTSAIHYFTIRRGAVNLFTGSKQTFSQGHVALKSKCHLVA